MAADTGIGLLRLELNELTITSHQYYLRYARFRVLLFVIIHPLCVHCHSPLHPKDQWQ